MDFLPVREEGAREFAKHAKKGLRFSEDIFFCMYAYKEDMLATELPKTFLSAALEDAKKPYGKFLAQKGLVEQARTALNVDMVEIPKDQLYKLLALHLPASDLFDLIGVDYLTRYFMVRLVSEAGTFAYSEEGGNVIYFVVNTLKKEMSVLHTTFM